MHGSQSLAALHNLRSCAAKSSKSSARGTLRSMLRSAAMFQNFVETADPTKGAERAAELRARLKELSLDGFIVPRADEYQGETVPESAERLAWLTGFTGSAGTAVVLADKAAIFVDGRYTIQVRAEVDLDVFEPVAVMETSVADWLKENVKAGGRIGYDPWLMTRAQVRRIADALETADAELVPVEANPVDAIWRDRPEPPLAQVSEQPETLAGRAAAEKIEEVGRAIADKRAEAAVLTDPASIAWLFNIRGSDVPHTPLPLSFAVVHAESRPELFIDGRKLTNAIRDTLEQVADVRETRDFNTRLAELGKEGRRVLYDRFGSAEAVALLIEEAGGTVVDGTDPVALPKAKKCAAELAGARAAHIRDGVAMMRFLRFVETSPAGTLTEIDAAKKLEALRVEAAAEDGVPLDDISFDTISSTGPNGAINHYRVTERTNRRLEAGDLYLIDSGGQYRDGTTDITRTVPVGDIAPERLSLYRDRFTRVLRGHIGIALARFPKGTTGAQLDPLARAALWQAGLDFDHGTGHGVGSYLGVHEGPQRISKTGTTPLEPGMIISNEPGYYAAGDFGIRIENLVVVREAEPVPGGDRPMHVFETITLAPIDRRLIEPRLMTPAEIAWLDTYHARVFGVLVGWPTLTEEERVWLEAACRPIVG
jgi:Xaa-Pro aminopeptidase